MTEPLFSIIVPTHNHRDLLSLSVRSALRQTQANFELFIIGDGATPETAAVADHLVKSDKRVTWLSHAKAARFGEEYRHQVLTHRARGQFVAYLCDDDLWMPNHLEELQKQLEHYDFVHTLPLTVRPGDDLYVYPGDLSVAESRGNLMKGQNFIPLTSVGHTMEFYRSLPNGWRPAPKEIFSDLYMFQEMLSTEGVRAHSSSAVTILNFPSPLRMEWSFEQRLEELQRWSRKIKDPGFQRALELEARRATAIQLAKVAQAVRNSEAERLSAQEQLKNLTEQDSLKDKELRYALNSERAVFDQMTSLQASHTALSDQLARLRGELNYSQEEALAWRKAATEYRRVIDSVERSRWFKLRRWLKSLSSFERISTETEESLATPR